MLYVDGLSVVYPDGTAALEAVSFRLAPGASAALAGGNGAGKTTLLHTLAGVLSAAKGSVRLDNVLLNKKTAAAFHERVGLVFQNPDDMLFMPTVYDDLAFGPRNSGLTESETAERIDTVLNSLGAAGLKHRSPLRLSGGEKRVIAIAAVLVTDPLLLLFDEPTAFLDMKSRRALIRLIQSLPQTKIIASHDAAFLSETCQHALLLQNGRLFASGAADTLLRDNEKMTACDLEAL